jgi:hypothetical protein
MSANRSLGGNTAAGLAAVAVAVCCRLPVLLSLAAGVTIVGLGLGIWLLAGAGLIVVVLAALGIHRRSGRIADHREGSVDADDYRAR